MAAPELCQKCLMPMAWDELEKKWVVRHGWEACIRALGGALSESQRRLTDLESKK